MLEYKPIEKSNIYKASRVIDLESFRPVFKTNNNLKETQNLWNDLKFQSFMIDLEEFTGIGHNKFQNLLKGRINNILNWANLFRILFYKD